MLNSAENFQMGIGCLSKDTELLTPRGWLSITQVTHITPVAQYFLSHQMGFINFTTPSCLSSGIVEKAYNITNTDGHVDQLIANHHSILFATDNNKAIVKPINDKTDYRSKIITGGYMYGSPDISLSVSERIRIAIQADGAIKKQSTNTDIVVFRLKKADKLERAKMLLAQNGAEYRVYPSRTDGCIHFVFSSSPGYYEKDFDWIDLSMVNLQWCRNFIEEISYWDSTIRKNNGVRNNHIQYFNNRKLAIDRVQAIAVLSGYRTCLSGRDRMPGLWNESYTLSISDNRGVLSEVVTKTLVDYNDYMYTVGVPSGFLITRRNNCVSVVPTHSVSSPYVVGDLILNACPV